jgi:FMN phosphatase YigB (HAD superfamily)
MTPAASFELDAAFTLFIDDHPDNVDAARGAGIQAVCLQPGQRLVDCLMPRRARAATGSG